MEGLDFGQIIIMLDYYIRKIMSLLDELLSMFGGSATTPEDTSDVSDELV